MEALVTWFTAPDWRPLPETWLDLDELCIFSTCPGATHLGQWHPETLRQLEQDYLPSTPYRPPTPADVSFGGTTATYA